MCQWEDWYIGGMHVYVSAHLSMHTAYKYTLKKLPKNSLTAVAIPQVKGWIFRAIEHCKCVHCISASEIPILNDFVLIHCENSLCSIALKISHFSSVMLQSADCTPDWCTKCVGTQLQSAWSTSYCLWAFHVLLDNWIDLCLGLVSVRLSKTGKGFLELVSVEACTHKETKSCVYHMSYVPNTEMWKTELWL